MTRTDPSQPDLTIILPCYNEQENIEQVTEELHQTLASTPWSYEILFIDDASTDGSLALLSRLHRQDPRVRVVSHNVNCGESAAQATGFIHARAELIVTMDSDGQNDPADIPRLIDALGDVDAVCGVRRKRRDNWVRRLSSRIANGFRNSVTGDRIADAGCTFRLLRGAALREVPTFNGMHRFLPTLLRMQGYRVLEIEVNHRPRIGGRSKYGIGNRLMRGILDCVAMRWWRRRAVPGRRTRSSTDGQGCATGGDRAQRSAGC